MNGYDYAIGIAHENYGNKFRITILGNQAVLQITKNEMHLKVEITFEEALRLFFTGAITGDHKVQICPPRFDIYESYPPEIHWEQFGIEYELILSDEFHKHCCEELITIASKRSNSCEKLAKFALEAIDELDLEEY